MKYGKKRWKAVIAAGAALMIVNTVAVYVLFGVNLFNPSGGAGPRSAASDPRSAAGPGSDAAAGNGAGGAAPSERTGAAAGEAASGAAAGDAAGGSAGTGTAPGGGAADAAEAGDPSSYFMTGAEVAYLENLSIADKVSAFSLIMKISRDEAEKIYAMAEDGITYSELEQIKAMLSSCLTPKDLELVYNLLEKDKRLYADSSG